MDDLPPIDMRVRTQESSYFISPNSKNFTPEIQRVWVNARHEEQEKAKILHGTLWGKHLEGKL